MSDANNLTKEQSYQFGSTIIKIIQGDILAPGVDVDAVVSTDDNYLTMGSGVARLLADRAGSNYVRAAQAQCPVRAGTAVVTKSYQLPKYGLNARYVLHGTVIDYDTEDLPLEQVVYQTTADCLEKAEKLGLKRILFPAFATGAGGLAMEACARQMCSAIKVYLAQERPLKQIYVILYRPEETDPKFAQFEEQNQCFIREANLVLGVPFNPTLNIHQARDFFGRAAELEQLEKVITDQVPGKRHAIILGGPQIGKWAFLDQFFRRAQQPDSPLSQGRRLVKATFGRVHENTPASFVYRKFLCALGEGEVDAAIRNKIRRAYADPDINRDRFLKFLEDNSDRFPQVIFLIDHIPSLLKMESKEAQNFKDIRKFWGDLDALEARVRFVCTAGDDQQYQELRKRLEMYAPSFNQAIEVIALKCIEDQERREWIDDLYQNYLGRSANDYEHRFFEEEAGRHPYLISLTGHALIEALKPDALANPTKEYNDLNTLAPFFQAAHNAMEGPRQAFFDLLMRTSLDADDRFELSSLAKAVEVESKRKSLVDGVQRGDPNAMRRWIELQAEGDPRQPLHPDRLKRLEDRGYLVDAASRDTAQFMAKSFATWMAESFGVGRQKAKTEQPEDVVISLLGPERQPGSKDMLIKTLFRRRGARIITAETPLQHKDLFMKNFDSHIRNVLYPKLYPDCGEFSSLQAVGDFILDYFTTSRIRGFLKNLPEGSTILLELDDNLKDIPWEFMLEAIYAGEIPFRVGRSIVSQDQPGSINPPVRGDGKVRALLIGDPTDDLEDARTEVQNLARLLQDTGNFTVDETQDILIGSANCRVMRLLERLRSGEYGLIHYSGHSVFENDKSAWVLKDGRINTLDLTRSLSDAPPALVFSSSCESAEAGKTRPIKYEDQTFDLPSAFLQAGVEAYVGTLWEVEASAARLYAEAFYRAFLIEGHSLGECLRQAKMATKKPRDRINWLSFILYGDPHLTPGDLFPALRKP